MDYLYDGTYSGLLCCVYAHYYVEKATGISREGEYQTNLLHSSVRVETDEEKAEKVYRAIRDKLGQFSLRRSYLAFLSCDPNKEMKLLRYLIFGFRTGPGFNKLHGHPDVFAVQELETKVYAERHRYLGILRFSVIVSGGGRSETPNPDGQMEMENDQPGEVLYAQVEPDNDLLELMVEHFLDRYRSEPFIIHDLKREKAVFASGGQWYIAPLERGVTVQLAQGEIFYRAMWKRYFEAIAIRERTNPRCQKAYMPIRYWSHLTEKLL